MVKLNGITVEMDGGTTKLQTALKEVNSEIKIHTDPAEGRCEALKTRSL